MLAQKHDDAMVNSYPEWKLRENIASLVFSLRGGLLTRRNTSFIKKIRDEQTQRSRQYISTKILRSFHRILQKWTAMHPPKFKLLAEQKTGEHGEAGGILTRWVHRREPRREQLPSLRKPSQDPRPRAPRARARAQIK